MLPVNDSQALADRYMHEDIDTLPPGQQQSYVDQRRMQVDDDGEPEDEDCDSCYEHYEVPNVPVRRNRSEEVLPSKFPRLDPVVVRIDEGNVSSSKESRVRDSDPELDVPMESLQPSDDDTRIESRGREKSRSPVRKLNYDEAHENSEPSRLTEEWNRTGTTGRGREYLERKEEPSKALLSFLADQRLPIPMAKDLVTKNESKEKRGKTLNCDKVSKEVRDSTAADATSGANCASSLPEGLAVVKSYRDS